MIIALNTAKRQNRKKAHAPRQKLYWRGSPYWLCGVWATTPGRLASRCWVVIAARLWKWFSRNQNLPTILQTTATLKRQEAQVLATKQPLQSQTARPFTALNAVPAIKLMGKVFRVPSHHWPKANGC